MEELLRKQWSHDLDEGIFWGISGYDSHCELPFPGGAFPRTFDQKYLPS